ncbi:KpsF/GutQ family sugar-phosphate isomerase [Aestuariivita sp.]|jgi:arabinose-5-phosphate isomerase|uniref:KpsF/GutQ family sugar-phosphate isomerase n=1 Tax=Aestuariivita sp. TaxID=1872407 RepID=UPI002171FAEC|nr:KpsF/GutQ family sugar-phosphate isomerase [Aestuariivita sp.]MCE8005443.1 KpsF/GutQ family sugar-phosphate isomerase [Aestuariivita sp.]
MSGYQDTARRVIQTEAEALGALGAALDDRFDQAVTRLLETKGRVIVTGIGKSGHIARKIAATLASTGTPAQFVHPAEASHGDLGMITEADTVLAISNSGEAPELANLLIYARRFAIPLIGMTSRMESTLAGQSDIVLPLPIADEACGTGVVPTSSTTMTLALGDALAVALMEHRRFTAAHFREFHPGGKLGAQLSLVRDLMHGADELPLAPLGTPMSDALLIMSAQGFGVVGVTASDGGLAGIITDGDLRRNMAGLLDHTVDQVMTNAPRTIAPDAMAQEALAIMTLPTPRITCLFVVDPATESPVGLIHVHDCLRAGLG